MNTYEASKNFWNRYGKTQYCPFASEKYTTCGTWCPACRIHPPIGTLKAFLSIDCFRERLTYDIEIINEGGNDK